MKKRPRKQERKRENKSENQIVSVDQAKNGPNLYVREIHLWSSKHAVVSLEDKGQQGRLMFDRSCLLLLSTLLTTPYATRLDY